MLAVLSRPSRCAAALVRRPAARRLRQHGERLVDSFATGSNAALARRSAREAALIRVRNIGVIAHIDAGKTTTTERMLYLVGETRHQGSVDTGDTVTDFLPQERERGITIQSAAVSLAWRNAHVNLIDTPGHVDFSVEVERCIRVLDGAVLVVDAVAGVQAQTETVWRTADHFQVPAVAFVNKMDRDGADFARAADSLHRRLGATPLPIQVPLGSAGGYCGAVDLLTMQAALYSSSGNGNGSAGTGGNAAPKAAARDSVALTHISLAAAEELDPGITERAAAARAALLEGLAEVDEPFLETYIAGGEAEGNYPLPELLAAVRRACLGRAAVPVLCGAALRGVGVEPLLDAVVSFLPSPLDRPPPRGIVMTAASAAAIIAGTPAAAASFAAVGNYVTYRHSDAASIAAAMTATAAGEAVSAGTVRKGRKHKQAGAAAASAGHWEAPYSGVAAVAEEVIEVDPLGDDLVALAFKVTHDKQRGPLVFFRVYSGQLMARATLLNSNTGAKERVQQLLQLHADEMRLMDSTGAGHVAAAVGLSGTRTGDTLLSADAPLAAAAATPALAKAKAAAAKRPAVVVGKAAAAARRGEAAPAGLPPSTPWKGPLPRLLLEGVSVPDPVFTLAVEPASAAEQAKLDAALAALAREDPSLHVGIDPDSGQTLLRGCGELHLEVALDRLAREFGAKVHAGRARVAYREGVAAAGTASRDVERTVGGRRLFAGVDVAVRPLPLSSAEAAAALAAGVGASAVSVVPAEVSLALGSGGGGGSGGDSGTSGKRPLSNVVRMAVGVGGTALGADTGLEGVEGSFGGARSSLMAKGELGATEACGSGGGCREAAATHAATAAAAVTVATATAGAVAKATKAAREAAVATGLSPDAAEALLSGLRDACGRGPMGGYPLVGAAAAVTAVRTDADTTPGALRLAVAAAFRDAVEAAGPLLLEPLMRVEVSAPAVHVGAVLNDLTGARRAHVTAVDAPASGGGSNARSSRGGGGYSDGPLARHTVLATVPLRELRGYATTLRSITGGEGSFSMELAGYGAIDAATAKAALAESW